MEELQKSSIKIHAIFLLLFAVVLGLNALALSELDISGIPLVFALAILFEILILLFFCYELIRVLDNPLKILWSILKSAWQGILHNEYVLRVKKKYPNIAHWIEQRFSGEKATGLLLTGGIVISLLFLFLFLGVAQDVIFKDPLVSVDQRILNLIPSIRTPEQTGFFSFITFLANWQSVVFVSLLVVIILFTKKQKFAALLFSGALLAGEGGVFVLKQLIGRMRPEQALSLITEDSFSFPSGHAVAATVIFGMVSYFLIKSVQHSVSKLLIFLGYIATIFCVALSRIYLGVHYPSDVIASMLFGGLVVSIFITIFEINERYSTFAKAKFNPEKRLFFVLILALIFSLVSHSTFIEIREVKTEIKSTVLADIDEKNIQRVPHFSETLTGNRMEPINFIYVGSEEQIKHLFLIHAWYQADPSTLSNTLKAVSVGLRNEQYLNGPVTPSYLNAKPNDLAFEKPTAANTFRARHHTRLWKTDFILPDRKTIWVATASLDKGIELSSTLGLPTHNIDPNIDAERSYIVTSLNLTAIKYIQVVAPQLGANSAGDEFFTDGKAAVIMLK